MNAAKYDQLQRGLTVQARKVLEVVPMLDAWNPAQVVAELKRQGSSMNDVRVVMGCLNSLLDNGLVVEIGKQTFRRVEVKTPPPVKEPRLVSVKTSKEELMAQPHTATTTVVKSINDPIVKLGALAMKLRMLAEEFDEVALELAEEAEHNNENARKFAALKEMFK